MNYTAEIKVMPLKQLLDPQGKAILGGLNNLGFDSIKDIRVGKLMVLNIEAESKEAAEKIAHESAEKLLANPVMEAFEITIH